MKISSKILLRSALISVFLASSAMAQSLGSPPRTQIYISVVNVADGKGVFVPAVWIEDAFGHRTQVLMGKDGLTREILYNQADLTAWVLQRYGQVSNPQVFYDDRSGDKDTQNPPAKAPPVIDCLSDTSDVKTIDDLPIVLVQLLPCNYDPCGASFIETPGLPMIHRIFDPCIAIEFPPVTAG